VERSGTQRVDVELLEADLEDADAPPPLPRIPLRSRIPRRAWWAVVAAVALTVAGTTVADRLQDASALARLAGVDGLSVPLDRPLAAAWRVPGTDVLGAVGDTVLARGPDAEGTVAVDAATGAVRWRRDGSCDLVPVGARPVRVLVAPARLEDRPDDLLLCLERPEGLPRRPRDGSTDGLPGRSVTAHVVDPATGAELRSIDVGGDGSLATVGADLVRVGVAADHHAEVTRWSLVTGEPRWTYRDPDVLPPNNGWGSYVDDRVVQLDIGPWALALDARTGRRIQRVPVSRLAADVSIGPVDLVDDASATSRLGQGGGSETTVTTADGRVRSTFPGLLLSPSVDDGSAPDRLVVTRGGPVAPQALAGVDPATGATHWTATAPPSQVVVLQGLVLVRDDAGPRALDARTGRTRWRSAGDGAGPATDLVTDGRRVLTVDAGPDGPVLVAREVTSGAVAWTRPAPDGAHALTQLRDGTVVVAGADELVALRP
jgi:outer membrane protein assembly factor BamB